jgi:BirA family transcriptional regulator, biotin operon repressor / biotin---[acetyl-CoA-carboxylase] ligase
VSWFGHAGTALAERLGVPAVEACESVDSTMDLAHELAGAGAAAGTLVVAEEQLGGRGRGGKRWTSPRRAGVYATVIERPATTDALDVLSLRVGLGLAATLERWTAAPIQLKWPNDLFVGGGKLAGILIEVRWRGQRADWVAVGVGVNLVAPSESVETTALQDADPIAVLEAIVPAVRAAAGTRGALSAAELAAFAARDLTVGRGVRAPAEGTARGITADGAILIESASGVSAWRAGSLVFSSDS